MDGIRGAANAYGGPLGGVRAENDASASILRKAIDAAKAESETLIEALPDEASGAAAHPVGNLGHSLDLRM